MTLIDLLYLVGFAIVVVAISALLNLNPFTVLPVAVVLAASVLVLKSVISSMRAYPKCGGPNCGARSYKLIGTMDDTGVNSGVIFECKKCGKKYVQKRLQFMMLDENLKPSSFMKRESIKSAWEHDG